MSHLQFMCSTVLLTKKIRERMVLPLWRSLASINLMLPKEERKAMLLRLYNDDSPLIDHSQNVKAGLHKGGAKTNGEGNSPPYPGPSDSVTADAAEGMKMEIEKDEDGKEKTTKIPTEEDYLQTEDLTAGAKQDTVDKLEQTAPVVLDERSDAFP